MSPSNSTPDDGGSAFPGLQFTEGRGNYRLAHGPNGEVEWEVHSPGMTLRDYLAAKALGGVLAAVVWQIGQDEQWVADAAYGLADAMLKSRAALAKSGISQQ